MSILYDYLKILEKKKGISAACLQAPVQQKRSVALLPYFVIGFIFLIGLAILFFLINTKSKVPAPPAVLEKINNSQGGSNLVTQDSYGLSSNNVSNLDYSLQGIIYNADSPSAIINGKLIEKNGKIGDWKVIEISPSEVEMENIKTNSLLTLKLNSPLE